MVHDMMMVVMAMMTMMMPRSRRGTERDADEGDGDERLEGGVDTHDDSFGMTNGRTNDGLTVDAGRE